MKTIIGITLFLLTSNLYAQTITASGKGSRSGMCSGYDGGHCADSLIKRARQEAITLAAYKCPFQIKEPIEKWWCEDVCTPSYFPPHGPDQYVTCRSECTIECEKED